MMQVRIAVDGEKRRVGKPLGVLHYGAALGCPVVEEHLMWYLGIPSAQRVLPETSESTGMKGVASPGLLT